MHIYQMFSRLLIRQKIHQANGAVEDVVGIVPSFPPQ